MVPLLKVASIGLPLAGVLGVTWWLSNLTGAPLCRDLSTDHDFSTESNQTYANKYASDYSKYFVGVSDQAKENSKGAEINNKDWWQWSFENRYLKAAPESIKEKFKNKKDGTQLKDACKAAYQAESSSVGTNVTENTKYEENNIWTFCSIEGNKPKSISENTGEKDSYSNSTYGKTDTYNTLLISTKDSNNDWFWKIKEEEFFGASSYLAESSDTSEFKTTYDKKEQYKDLTHMKVKEICGKAYNSDSTSTTSPTFPKKSVFKFCSLTGKEPESK